MMDNKPQYDFAKEWKRLKEEMDFIRSRLENIHSDPSVLEDTIGLLNRMGEQRETLEKKLDDLSRFK